MKKIPKIQFAALLGLDKILKKVFDLLGQLFPFDVQEDLLHVVYCHNNNNSNDKCYDNNNNNNN